jgi:hypothetical protein
MTGYPVYHERTRCLVGHLALAIEPGRRLLEGWRLPAMSLTAAPNDLVPEPTPISARIERNEAGEVRALWVASASELVGLRGFTLA